MNQLLAEKLHIKVPTSIQNIDCGIYKTQQFPRFLFSSQFRLKNVLQLQTQLHYKQHCQYKLSHGISRTSSVERDLKNKNIFRGGGELQKLKHFMSDGGH